MLIVALQYPFRRVVGIELLAPLAATARRNVARYPLRCEIFEADASSFPLPDEATVVYVFNSFGADVLPEVFRRIDESLARRPRRIRLLTYGIEPVTLSSFFEQQPQVLALRLLLYVLEPSRVSI